jgi:peptidoglycan/xylan/chitin deacetylase (PgdA/CDA1 family)
MAFWFPMIVAATVTGLCAGESKPNPLDQEKRLEFRAGGIVRGPKNEKKIALVFTGHTFSEGGETILSELARHGAKASFFLTGDFLANTDFSVLVKRIIEAGHYLGPHSDRHLLYCSWESAPKSLVTREEFLRDVQQNVDKIDRLGAAGDNVRYVLPAFEHYNQEIADWTRESGRLLVNFTPGTRSTADYTGEAETNFVSSQVILDSVFAAERRDRHGLNGFLLLLHIGAGPGRADKFHARFGELLDYLARRGYQFVRVDELLGKK